MNHAITKVEGTPPQAYNPAGIFNFHMVRIATSMSDLNKKQTVVCRDFVTNNNTLTMYSIHKPFTFNAYDMNMMDDVPFKGHILKVIDRSEYYRRYGHIPSYVEHGIRGEYEQMDHHTVDGYVLLESKTINVNRLDDAESHTTDPNDKIDNIWYKINKSKAKDTLTRRKLIYVENVKSKNEHFVSEHQVDAMYNHYLKVEQQLLDEDIRMENEKARDRAKTEYEHASKKYKHRNFFYKIFNPEPKELDFAPTLRDPEKLTKVSEDLCKSVTRVINEFNERHGNLLDLTHVFNKFGKPE